MNVTLKLTEQGKRRYASAAGTETAPAPAAATPTVSYRLIKVMGDTVAFCHGFQLLDQTSIRYDASHRPMVQAEIDDLVQRGELARLIRSKDWTETPLGSRSTWPSSLRTTLRLMLSSRYAMWMGWGPELIFFYNDAYAEQTLGAKHPWALGRPACEVWAEIWPTLEVRINHVLATGEATWDEGLLLFLVRSGYPEETYHTFSYSAAPGECPGEIGGLFCVVIEETERVINERRIAFLRDLASSIAQTKSAEQVYAAVERCLSADARDMPFSATYLLEGDGQTARRVSQTGFAQEHRLLPEALKLTDSSIWQLHSVIENSTSATVALPAEEPWPTGPWENSPSRALVVPIPQPGQVRSAGAFVVGVNPHRRPDAALQSFVALVVGQLAAGLSNAGAYEDAQRRAEVLAELDRAKTTFFSNVSHEFRTPLTLMLGPTEDALGSPERTLQGAELETVHRNALRLLKLVNGLLDFARIEAGRIQAAYEPTDLRELTADLASTFRSAIERAALAFIVDCETLPEPIYVDRDMWEKIVLHLLSNALKFTFDGAITVSLRWQNAGAVLTVQDTGVGIEASELPRLFERFHRIEGARARTHEGSGIDLALVHELVRLHGGSIEVTSNVGAGTRFVVAIPKGMAHLSADRIGTPRSLATRSARAAYVAEALRWMPDSSNGEMPSAPELNQASTPEAKRPSARILVADDNADMREYITRLLQQHWTVDVAADGFEALEAARRAPPDLVLSDVMMPRLDGYALIRELRGDPRTAVTPIILLSARAGEEATAEGLRSGADDYLVKPFSASALVVRVESQLSAARLREAMRRTAEAERQRLETMFQESPAAICVLRGPQFTIEHANPNLFDLWNLPASVVGKPLLEVLPEMRGQDFEQVLRRVLDTGVPCQGKEQLSHLGRDGATPDDDTYFDFVYTRLRGADGVPDAVFIHAYDVTDKVNARRTLEQLREAEQLARKDADAANRLKDEFLATMSHELRTPLNAILGWASLMRSNPEDRSYLDRALATIERNARTQARLIEDILDVSRIISGKLSLDVKRIDLIAIARATVDVIRPAADAKRVRLLFDASLTDAVEVIGDADRFQQIIWNLLSNAVKFTPAGGRVALEVHRGASSARIIVSDTGDGIEAEHLPFIFERFRQVDSSTTRKSTGLGLGLAIVRHLAELHGGFVVAESPGLKRGATFTVHIPIRAAHETEPNPRADETVTAAPRVEQPPSSLSGIKILVIDDDEDSRLLLQSALGRVGATVKAVESAAAALLVLDEQSIDVLISDVGMPGEDGYSFLKRLRPLTANQARQVPAIALTAYARREDIARALEAGFQRHLSKPADIDELTRAVASLVSER